MTDNRYWIFLEKLRRSGITNMYGSAPYLENAFELSRDEAIKIVSEWMRNYNPSDYEGGEMNVETIEIEQVFISEQTCS